MSLFSSLHCAFIVVSTVLVVVSTSRYDNINTAYLLGQHALIPGGWGRVVHCFNTTVM